MCKPSQDNCDHMVKKLEKGSTITYAKFPQINLRTSYQKIDKPKIKKKHMSCALSAQHWDTSHLNVPIRNVTKQSSLKDKEAYLGEDTLFIKKKAIRLLTVQKKK
jgi:hypothetical protein